MTYFSVIETCWGHLKILTLLWNEIPIKFMFLTPKFRVLLPSVMHILLKIDPAIWSFKKMFLI